MVLGIETPYLIGCSANESLRTSERSASFQNIVYLLANLPFNRGGGVILSKSILRRSPTISLTRINLSH